MFGRRTPCWSVKAPIPLCSAMLVFSYCPWAGYYATAVALSYPFTLEMLSSSCVTFLKKRVDFLMKCIACPISLLWLYLRSSLFVRGRHFKCLVLVYYIHIGPPWHYGLIVFWVGLLLHPPPLALEIRGGFKSLNLFKQDSILKLFSMLCLEPVSLAWRRRWKPYTVVGKTIPCALALQP